jgi:hypothetical protein
MEKMTAVKNGVLPCSMVQVEDLCHWYELGYERILATID